MARVLAKHALRLDIEVSKGLVGRDTSYPYIKASSWIKTLDATGYLQNLLGLGDSCSTLELAGPSLQQFWSKYELAHGDHEVFNLARSGKLRLAECVPIYIHGDEGTAYKKDGALVMSFFCPLGKGTLCQKVGDIGGWKPTHEFRRTLFPVALRPGDSFQGATPLWASKRFF